MNGWNTVFWNLKNKNLFSADTTQIKIIKEVGFMSNVTVYLMAERNTEVQSEDVFLKDVASVRCADSQIEAKVKSIKIHKFHSGQDKK